ncbi:UDP-3-O-(3-hydroxymyristoyl)glucosamine N-acyltransferase, partial [bacterium]|nr:UDP-3-O-(3-hydroxymyristoyl)glucosamine N-acyltransferase [bacterium]
TVVTVPFKAVISCIELPNISNQIIVKNARQAMATTIALFYPESRPAAEISSDAFIHATATISDQVIVEAGCTIGANVIIGDRCHIMTGARIGESVIIGEDTIIYPNVVIYKGAQLGKRNRIHAGTVIGSDGFGYFPDAGKWGKIPHIGTVIIGDDVEIGANTTIDKSVFGATLIGDGTKIDNLVHIAHNTQIGSHSAIAAQAGLMGSAKIGNRVQIGGQAGISDTIVGDNVIITARAGVTKKITSPGVYSGFPAWEHRNELKKDAWVRTQAKKRKGPDDD